MLSPDSHTPCPPYPLFVRLDGELVVVVGAGRVAVRKVAAMLEYGARVHVIAPEADEAVVVAARNGYLTWYRRTYEDGDLQGARLAIVASSDASVNKAASDEARRCGILVNVVDVPELCTCTVPSIMRRGQLQIAVSTNGAAPAVARELRRELEGQFEAWWEDYIDLLAQVRVLVKERVPEEPSERAPLFEAVCRAGIERDMAAGARPSAVEVFDSVVAPLLEGRAS